MNSKKNECPKCGEKITDFVMDFDSNSIRCVKCQSDFDASKIFNNTSVNFLAKLVPSEKRDDFLNKLGFECQPIRRTSIFALIFIITLMLGSAIISAYDQREQPLKMALIMAGGIAFLFTILMYYKNEAKPKWKRKA
jgi:hypothetical protein